MTVRKMHEYPEKLFVVVENKGTQDEYLSAAGSPGDHAVVGETVAVALYQFMGMVKVKSTTTVE